MFSLTQLLAQLILSYLVGASVMLIMILLSARLLRLNDEEGMWVVRMAARVWFTPWRAYERPARTIPMEVRG